MNTPDHDQRLDPTPDYGNLGPGPDPKATPQKNRRLALAAVAAGVALAVVFVGAKGTAQAAWEEISQLLTLQGKPEAASPAIMSQHELENLDSASPQSQAQLLLERAINHYDGATDQIATRVDGWRGKIKLDSQLNSLFTTALNANDLRVRAAAIEVDLAGHNVAKTPESAQRFAQQAESNDKTQRIWGLWMLGLLGNRGVEADQASRILISHLQDTDQDIRYWAVEGLAYLGTNDSIEPLLKTFHDDPSPTIRERAACGLAQSGMLNEEQRRSAIPQLLNFADDASLDAQTHTWVYQALRDITGQNLPNDPGAWRSWYGASGH